MRLLVVITCCLCMAIPCRLVSLDGKGGESLPAAGLPEGEAEEKRDLSIDATALYGQYNRLIWSGSLAQGLDDFSYRLQSDFSRSNDFGYRNSLFYNHKLGFAGDFTPSEKWRFSPDLEVRNDSYGMFRNPFYGREEKDGADVKFKTEYTPMPMRWTLDVAGIYFHHRLDSSPYQNALTIKPSRSSDFYGAGIGLGWEYVWSASNRLDFKTKFSHYHYSTG
ncbi:MAG: hypothetical protein E4G96_09990, partial [Chrysiogenales bacterium]